MCAGDTMIRLQFHGDIKQLLKPRDRARQTICYLLNRRTSIKDIIESLGVPHTEVGSISTGDVQLDFEYIALSGEVYDVFANSVTSLPTKATTLRPTPLSTYRFLVDINVGKIARLLRMAGLDTAAVLELDPLPNKREIAQAGSTSNRILLSRDKEILKLRDVTFGRLIRSQDPYQQLKEVIDAYQLHPKLVPFSRCMKCNHMLEAVAKEIIINELEPLTRKYYNKFKRCVSCKCIYWRGTHYQRMRDIIEHLSTQNN